MRKPIAVTIALFATLALAAPAFAQDPKPVPGLEVADITVLENGIATFTVRLHDGPDQTVTVNYGTVDGTAKVKEDYGFTVGTLTFAPGETAKSVTVGLRNDPDDERDETFGLVLSGQAPAEVVMVKSSAIATLVDDDPSCVVPNIIGLTRTGAVRALHGANCGLALSIRRYNAKTTKDRVYKISPKAGMTLPAGANQVTIVLSKGPKPAPKKKSTAKKKSSSATASG
jgi:Calx-beta domain/PASTA domain